MTVERWICIGIVLLAIGDIIQNSKIDQLATQNQETTANVESLHADLRKMLDELKSLPEEIPTPEPEADLFDESPKGETL